MTQDALISFVALLGILAIFYGPWQDLCADWARQVVFEQRDKLFDYAHDGRISFDSAEYKVLRSGFEASIRFAHGITFAKYIYFAFFLNRLHQTKEGLAYGQSSLTQITALLNDVRLKNDILRLIYKANMAIVSAMCARSIIFALIFPLCIVFSIGYFCFSSVRAGAINIVSKIGESIQVEAESVDQQLLA